MSGDYKDTHNPKFDKASQSFEETAGRKWLIRDHLKKVLAGFKMATNVVQDATECCLGMFKAIP